MCSSFVYIMASPSGGRFSPRIASDLVQAVWQDRAQENIGSSVDQDGKRLVWYREFSTLTEAETECARIDALPAIWKTHLVESENADLRDLWTELDAQPVIKPAAYQAAEVTEPRYPVLRLATDGEIIETQAPHSHPAILIRRRAS